MLSRIKPLTTELISPVALRLAKLGVKPNHLTFSGLIFALVSSYLIIERNVLLASVFVLFSSLCDLLDGALARKAELTSNFGAFLDSVSDRYVDVILFISLGIYGVNWIVVALAMSGALLVSYTRARAENIIEKCDVGIAERSERLLILLLGMVSGYIYEAVLLIAILSHITALHRVVYTYLKMR
ncbi:MAG: CDP-alcohol phosphatidyltransferase family protein [Archaeoglobus sp.]|uniref:CDP-alcohol phosphatidyltransferase family protein n=1 Tax=Archaeoglobus sp. TaxID=1872626 RepID=UPI001D8E01F5|nr:CDP-alcohol phosphatidyltransferase family protein [Archaeoglobus sp.]MBO8180519.1 CDP-alcohol phosphatidyltransferase family protein [Archaeoglobus sp.]